MLVHIFHFFCYLRNWFFLFQFYWKLFICLMKIEIKTPKSTWTNNNFNEKFRIFFHVHPVLWIRNDPISVLFFLFTRSFFFFSVLDFKVNSTSVFFWNFFFFYLLQEMCWMSWKEAFENIYETVYGGKLVEWYIAIKSFMLMFWHYVGSRFSSCKFNFEF